MDSILGFLILAIIIGIFCLISYAGSKVEEKKIDIKKSKKKKDDVVLQKQRDFLNIKLPLTIEGHYPVLLLPTDKEVYQFGEGYHWIKPEFKSSINYKNDIFGASERKFFQILHKYFDINKLKHNQYSIRINDDLYIPDITYIDNNKKIFVDIEIDEPYSFKTKEPIHFTSSDHIRNIYIQRGGWAVIRFSERQIIQQPVECCKFIAAYLAYAYMDNNYTTDFSSIKSINSEKCWTKKEAQDFALRNYRNTYL